MPMASPRTFTTVQISDCHLNPEDRESVARFEALRERVTAEAPDLIVASGDVSDDGYRHAGFFEYVQDAFNHWPAPVLVIPGNHDIGDKAGEANAVQPDYVARWKEVFGSDRFTHVRDGWVILGINTQVVGSGLPEEGEQRTWLDDALDRAEAEGQNAAIFLHAAAYLFDPEEVLAGGSQYWGFDPYPRRELVKRLHRPHVRLVANGHLHWHHCFERFNAKWVWCPSQHLVVDDAIFPRGGGVTGFLRHDFADDGVTVKLVALDGPSHTIRVFRPTVAVPDGDPVTIAEVVLDVAGTLTRDGQLLRGVADRLHELSRHTRINLLAPEPAPSALASLPVEWHIAADGGEKRQRVEALGREHTVAIGNGRDDVAMLQDAAIGIAVVGPEGLAASLLPAADVIVHDILDALDLLAHPTRLAATLQR